jgi:protein gp37
MAKSKIEWTNTTWNPITGCSKISPGCKFCYAERLSKRLKAMGLVKYANVFKVTLHPNSLQAPLQWKSPRLIFVNSMSDLFHERVPDEFIHQIFNVMQQAHWHQFQVLTKRSQRLLELSPSLPWSDNIWMGVSVENEDYIFRIRDLKRSKAHTKFLSLEPLLGPLPNLNLKGINWVIVGGESGPGARPLEKEWVVDIRDQCVVNQVPFFFKQWGGVLKKRTGRTLDGKTWNQMPQIFSGAQKSQT